MGAACHGEDPCNSNELGNPVEGLRRSAEAKHCRGLIDHSAVILIHPYKP